MRGRRDFTMKRALCRCQRYCAGPAGGLTLIYARGGAVHYDASQRIRARYLRILRFFRFFAWVWATQPKGWNPDGLAACAALGDGIAPCRKHAVGAEDAQLLGALDRP